MQKLLIDGKKVLSGKINISGSKNSTLPILAATILNNNTKINNIPFVNDIFTMLNLLIAILVDVVVNQNEKKKNVANMKVRHNVEKLNEQFSEEINLDKLKKDQ